MNQMDLDRYHPTAKLKMREAPNNVEAEQALLGAVLINNDAFSRVSDFLKAEHFYEPLHSKIWEAIVHQKQIGKSVNPVTLKTLLPAEGRVGDMTVAQYLARMVAEAVSIINVADYGRAVYDLALRRFLISIGEDAVNLAYDSPLDAPPKEQIEQVQERLSTLLESSVVDDVGFVGDEIPDQYLSMVTGTDRSGSTLPGVPIALPEIATVLAQKDFSAGRLYGILAASGEGKTSLTLQLLYHSMMNGNPTLFLSYDQSGLECTAQMIAQQTGIEFKRQVSGDMTDKEIDRCYEISKWIGNAPFEVIDCDSTKDTARRLSGYVSKFVKKHKKRANLSGEEMKTPLVVIDHMRTIKVDSDDQRSDEGSKALSVGNQLKSMGKREKAAVVVLQQRGGAGLKRPNPRPIKSDLYGGEGARQPFDAIAYLYRAEIYMNEQIATATDERESDRIEARFRQQFGEHIEDMAEIGALKVRFGNPNQRRKVRFNARFTRYESLYQNDYSEQGSLV